MQLAWLPPESGGQNGIIQRYLISVTEVDTMRQFQLTSASPFATVLGLHPHYTYSFAVAAVTVGEGPYSEEISVQTLEDGEQMKKYCQSYMMYNLFCCCFPAPNGPPQSFRVVAISSTSIRLTWTAPLPEEQNGVITSYRITVTEVESGEEVLQRTTASSVSFLIVDSLRPYYGYRCTIAAFTIAIGPEALVEVTTFQEGNIANRLQL